MNKQSNFSSLFGWPALRQKSSVILVGVPWEVTVSYREGASLAPQSLLKSSSQIDLYDFELKDTYRSGFFLEPISEEIKEKNRLARHQARKVIQEWEKSEGSLCSQKTKTLLEQVNQACQEMVDWVYKKTKKILSENKIPGLIGGDHSISLGAVKAFGEEYKQYGILQIDAHLDLRPSYQGFTYSHASVMHNVLNLLLPPQKIVSVGVRDFSQKEWKRVQSETQRLVCFTNHEIKSWLFQGRSWKSFCEKIISELPQNIYLSVDVDGFSPNHFPQTGTPVPGGLSFDQFIYFLMKLVREGRKRIIGFDLCELASHHEESLDANIGMRLLYQMCGWSVKSQED